MNSLATPGATNAPSQPAIEPDYSLRALALWPRLERHRLVRVRHDPHRIAALVGRRTTLSRNAILALLGARPFETDG
jgi:hypothetical protein